MKEYLCDSNSQITMLGIFKINTATLICSAFIFRILFINIGVIYSLNIHQNDTSVKKHFSSVTKRRKHFEPCNSSDNAGYLSLAIVEEDSDNEDQFKLNSFFLLHVFYSKVESKIESALKKITSFNKHFFYSSSNRYLEYRVFRI